MRHKSPAGTIDNIADRSTILIPTFSLGDAAGGPVKQLRTPKPVETGDQQADVNFHPSGSRHTVQFYENEEFLVGTVGEFLATAVRTNNPAAVIATPDHWEAIRNCLIRNDFDVQALISSGQLTVCDADQTLA